jgi:hypothetical protein
MTQSWLAYKWEETCKLLSMMVLDALGNIVTRLESQKIVGTENLLDCTWGTGQNQFPPDLTSMILGMRAPNFAHRLLTRLIIKWEEQSHPLEEPLSSSRLASVKSCWKMHGVSSDVKNGKILVLSGVQSKATSGIVRIDTVCQSWRGRLSVLT